MCNHPNIVSLYEFFISDKFISIVIKQASGCTLLEGLEKNKHDYTTKRILEIIFQLGKVLNHFQLSGIVWCNLTHENILYDGKQIFALNFSESIHKKKLNGKANILRGLRGIINLKENWNMLLQKC